MIGIESNFDNRKVVSIYEVKTVPDFYKIFRYCFGNLILLHLNPYIGIINDV